MRKEVRSNSFMLQGYRVEVTAYTDGWRGEKGALIQYESYKIYKDNHMIISKPKVTSYSSQLIVAKCYIDNYESKNKEFMEAI